MESVRIQPAFDGVDTESAPDYLDGGKAPVVENLLGRPGKLILRGPLRQSIDLTDSTFFPLSPVWNTLDWVLLAYSTTDVTDPQTYNVNKLRMVTLPSGPVTNFASVFTLSPWFTRAGNHVYGSHRSAGAWRVLRWTPGADTFADYAIANAPNSDRPLLITTHLNRLIIWGGANPGGAGLFSTALFWSDPVPPAGLAVAASSWQDDVSGLTNRIDVSADGEPGTAVARLGRNLALFTPKSTYLLLGDAPSNWTIRPLSRTYGCADPGSIVESSDGVYFMSRESGYMFTDGVSFRTVSAPVQADLVSLVSVPITSTARAIRATRLPNDYIQLSIVNTTSAPPTTLRTWLIHTPTNTWMQFSVDPAISNMQARALGRTINNAFMIADKRLWLLDELGLPEVTPAGARGFDDNAGVGRRIPAKWYSRLQKLSSPGLASQLNRLLLDYAWMQDGAGSATDGWYVSLVDGQGTVLVPEFQVPGQLDPPTQLARRRHQVEAFPEATDAQIRVEWKGTPFVGIERAEIYDATIEFTPGRKRPNA